jgi:hypothetical protein
MVSRPAPSGAEMMDVENKGGGAEVTCLVGRCFVVTPDLEPVRALAAGDRLGCGDRLRVADGSKIELRLADDSHVRLDAGSVAVIKSLSLDPSTGLRFVDVGIIMGKLWATTAPSPSAEDRFDVSTRTAVVSGRGAVFRMNVNDDQAAVIKVYDGAVEVKSPSALTPESAGDSTAVPVPPPPQAEAMEPAVGVPAPPPPPPMPAEWAVVLQPMQQMEIHADGTAAAPVSFSCRDDLTDWVLWNHERDLGERKGKGEVIK